MGKPPVKKTKKTACIDKDTMALLEKTIQEEREESDTESEYELDPTDSTSVINTFVRVFKTIHKKMKTLEEQLADRAEGGGAGVREEVVEIRAEVEKLMERVRMSEDETDEIKQRSLKGNLIISSPNIPNRNIKSLIKSDAQLASENKSLTNHILELIYIKYGVRVPVQDIQALHRLPNSTLVLRIWRRTEDSAWFQLVNAIKTGGDQHQNFYLNFHLTHRRSKLVYELRQYKKAKKIHKFMTDENGAIAVKLNEQDAKIKLTFHRKRDDETPEKTFTINELHRLVPAHK